MSEKKSMELAKRSGNKTFFSRVNKPHDATIVDSHFSWPVPRIYFQTFRAKLPSFYL